LKRKLRRLLTLAQNPGIDQSNVSFNIYEGCFYLGSRVYFTLLYMHSWQSFPHSLAPRSQACFIHKFVAFFNSDGSVLLELAAAKNNGFRLRRLIRGAF